MGVGCVGRCGRLRGGNMGFRRGVSWIPILTRVFFLSVKSKSGESRLSGESWGLDGVWGGEGWVSPVGARGDSLRCAVGTGGDSTCWGEDDDVAGSF